MLSGLCWKTWHTLTAKHCHICQWTHPQLSLYMMPYMWLYLPGLPHPESRFHLSFSRWCWHGYLLYFITQILFLLSFKRCFSYCTHAFFDNPSISKWLFVLTQNPSNSEGTPITQHPACCWAVYVWLRILVNWSYWALRQFIFCALTSDLSGYGYSKPLCFVS